MPFWNRKSNTGAELDALLVQGHRLVHQGWPEEALPIFERCVALQPASGLAWSSLGQALLDARWLPEALTALGNAVRLTPEDVAA